MRSCKKMASHSRKKLLKLMKNVIFSIERKLIKLLKGAFKKDGKV